MNSHELSANEYDSIYGYTEHGAPATITTLTSFSQQIAANLGNNSAVNGMEYALPTYDLYRYSYYPTYSTTPQPTVNPSSIYGAAISSNATPSTGFFIFYF